MYKNINKYCYKGAQKLIIKFSLRNELNEQLQKHTFRNLK